MISLYDSVTFGFLPAEMKTPEYEAVCYAVDNQVKKYIVYKRRAHIWANLEDVADEHLDMLAVECRVLFYNTDLAPDIKRKLILNSMYWYMKLGTSQAMREMIDIVFENYNTTVEEWYTYAGEPFHFMVAVDSNVTQLSIAEFLRYLNTVKNARSRFDYLILQNSAVIRLTTFSDVRNFVYTFCGPMECGTYPDIDTGLQLAEESLVLTPDGTERSAFYDHSGTIPDIAIGFELAEERVVLEGGADQFATVYPGNDTESGTNPDIATGFQPEDSSVTFCGDTDQARAAYDSTGTNPEIAVGGVMEDAGIGLEGSPGETPVVYPSDSEAESGTYPAPSTGFTSAESGVETEAGSSESDLYYNQASEDDFAGDV